MAKHTDDRPHPLRHTATWIGIAGGVGVGGALFGVTELTELPSLVEPVVISLSAGGALYGGAQVTARRGEKYVTPVSNPRDDEGNPLVPEKKAVRIEDYSI